MAMVLTVEETQSLEVSTGERGCGKSLMDLYVMGWAMWVQDDWDLITDPVASLQVDSCWGNRKLVVD